MSGHVNQRGWPATYTLESQSSDYVYHEHMTSLSYVVDLVSVNNKGLWKVPCPAVVINLIHGGDEHSIALTGV